MANCNLCGRKLPTFSFGDGACKWCKQYQAAQRGELPEDAKQEVMPAPWARHVSSSMLVTKAIMTINVMVFIAMVAAGASMTDPGSKELVRWGANYGPLTQNGEWWRLLTSAFVHIGIVHIALNMWCLWSLGELAESLYGEWTFAVVYLTCGIAGSLGSLLWHTATVSAGASGAIFGIAGALIASFKLGEFSLPRAAIQVTLRSVTMFAIYNLAFGAISGRVDNAGHIGGLVMGLILGALIAKVAPARDKVGPRVLALGLAVVLLAGGIGWYQYSHRYRAHLRRGMELVSENKPDEALAELQTAVKLKPDYATAHERLSIAYTMKGNYQAAEAALKRAMELDPSDASPLYSLASIYETQKQPEKAREIYRQLLAMKPGDAYAHAGLASVAVSEGQDELAVQEYEKALELDPEYEGGYYRLGLSLAKLKRYDEAIEAYKKEQELSGEGEYISEALAEAYAAKGASEGQRKAK